MQLQSVPISHSAAQNPQTPGLIDDSPGYVQASIDEINEKAGNLILGDTADTSDDDTASESSDEDFTPRTHNDRRTGSAVPPHFPEEHNTFPQSPPPPGPQRRDPRHHGHHPHRMPHHGHYGHSPHLHPQDKHRGPPCPPPGDKAHRHHRAHSPPGWAKMKHPHGPHPCFGGRGMFGGRGGFGGGRGGHRGAHTNTPPFEGHHNPPPPPRPADFGVDALSTTSNEDEPSYPGHFGGPGRGGRGNMGYGGIGMGRGGMRGHRHDFPPHPTHLGPCHSGGLPPPFGPVGNLGPHSHHFGPPASRHDVHFPPSPPHFGGGHSHGYPGHPHAHRGRHFGGYHFQHTHGMQGPIPV